MISLVACGIIVLILPWVICIPVALIFRMPISYRKKLEGVKTRKLNQAFKEIDSLMSTRYTIGYFICFSTYIMMTITVLFFNYIYPSDYCLKWLYQLVVIYFLDLIVFTFGFAAF